MSMDNHEIDRGSLMTPRLIVGLAIALFGVVLVLDRLNLVVADQVLNWWPAVIVAIGAVMFPSRAASAAASTASSSCSSAAGSC